MTKGISAVISVVLLLLVAIGLIFAVYTWVTGTTSSGMSAGSQKMGQVETQLQTSFQIESAVCNEAAGRIDIYLFNSGSTDVWVNKTAVYFDGGYVDASQSNKILKPGERTVTGDLYVSFANLPGSPTSCDTSICNHRIKVTYRGVSQEALISCH